MSRLAALTVTCITCLPLLSRKSESVWTERKCTKSDMHQNPLNKDQKIVHSYITRRRYNLLGQELHASIVHTYTTIDQLNSTVIVRGHRNALVKIWTLFNFILPTHWSQNLITFYPYGESKNRYSIGNDINYQSEEQFPLGVHINNSRESNRNTTNKTGSVLYHYSLLTSLLYKPWHPKEFYEFPDSIDEGSILIL